MPLFTPVGGGASFTIKPANNYVTTYFLASTSFTVTGSKAVDIVLVGGGGGGGVNTSGSGGNNGGGGGAGGVRELTSVTLNPGTTYTVTIGAGGSTNTDGGQTSISNITNGTAGGGGRGGYIMGDGSASPAGSGASGGGGSDIGPFSANRGTATGDGFGYDGIFAQDLQGGGGGGAGGIGSGASGGAARTNWAGTFSKGGDGNAQSRGLNVGYGSGGHGGNASSFTAPGNSGIVVIRYSLV